MHHSVIKRCVYTILLIGGTYWAQALPKAAKSVIKNSAFDVIVSRRDTLQSIFYRYGLDKKDLYAMLAQVNNAKLASIRPGQLIHFDTINGKRVVEMKIFLSNDHIIKVHKVQSGFKLDELKTVKKGYYSKVEFALKRSLYVDGKRHGLSVANLAEIDQVMRTDPTIDPKRFSPGTKIAVVLEGDGTKNSVKSPVSIHVLQGKKKWSVTRFHDKYGNHFYHPDGSTAAVSFLKYPLSKFRVSSHFSLNRYHPIHRYRRAHYGVDLAAARGSPIWATAPGKVVYAGNKGGYGKTIILQHGSQYQTIYAHMSRFAKGLKSGDVVKQKQIIGYVGSTGHATGPHLHYELRVKGKPIDPMRAKLPKKATLKGDLYKAFQQYQSHLLKALASKAKAK